MFINLGLYFGVSIFTKQSQEEEKQALIFVESVKIGGAEGGQARGLQTVDEIRDLLGRYIGRTEAASALEGFIVSRGIDKSAMQKEEVLKLRDERERISRGPGLRHSHAYPPEKACNDGRAVEFHTPDKPYPETFA